MLFGIVLPMPPLVPQVTYLDAPLLDPAVLESSGLRGKLNRGVEP